MLMKIHLYLSAMAVCLMAACGNSGHNDHHQHEEESAHEAHSDEIVLTPEKAKAAGVETETVEPAPFRYVIPTGGQLLAAQGEEATVVASTAGVVSFTRPLTDGTAVQKGAALLSVSARNIQDGDPVGRARIAYLTAKDEYERAARLAEKQIVTKKELNRLKEEFENARIAYEALRPNHSGNGVQIQSPLTGYVKSCLVKEGDFVTVGQALLSVTQTRRLTLRAEVSERYYAQLSGITSANFRTPYDGQTYSLSELKGRLLSKGKAAGEGSYYIPVSFEFDNCGQMVPGSYVECYLLSAEKPNVTSVPNSALTEEQGVYFVYLQIDEEGYRKQEVKLGMTDGKRTEITAGLNPGDKVVTQGAIHVKLASASAAIPAHTHNH